ncbi:peptidoglycan DD-metalloendopeptidase family protein [Novosphingobium aquiterrae]|uniref:Peptidoglycan DD-metalloendopeptidase family protein n=1 Tax=Novosphingobium aquiterrae TaxID=624388 RepID=A0ABV6PFD7_9SPHN
MRGAAALLLAASVLLIAAADPDPKTETTHVVKDGETLGGIANRAEMPRVLIIEANGLKAPYALRLGQKLVIPRRRIHTVKDGETGFGIAMDYGVPWSAIATASGIDPKAAVKPGQKLTVPTLAKPPVTASPLAAALPAALTSPSATPSEEPAKLADTPAPAFRWPVDGKVRRGFVAKQGDKPWHDGIDVIAPRGTAVRAAAAGKVIFAGDGPREYGKTVILFHSGRWTTTYSYLDQITIKDGETVGAGERIGFNGQTGLASEPQLHFEVRRNRVPLDPAKYLPKAKKP